MPVKYTTFALLIFQSLLFNIACDSEAQKTDSEIADNLIGYWEVNEAIRNNRRTTTMEDAWFEFLPDHKTNLNLDGTDQSGSYNLEGEVIQISGTTTDGDYRVINLSGDSLSLTTSKDFGEITFNFVFHLLRAEKPLPEEGEDI